MIPAKTTTRLWPEDSLKWVGPLSSAYVYMSICVQRITLFVIKLRTSGQTFLFSILIQVCVCAYVCAHVHTHTVKQNKTNHQNN